MSPSAIVKLPMSAKDAADGLTQCNGWSPSSNILLACRIADGPNRAPGRFVVPRSKGIPATQTGALASSQPTPRNVGGTAKVATPVMTMANGQA
jgi:hypothetical protein